jgi:hypothetical protein
MPFLINIIRFQANSYIRATFEGVFRVVFPPIWWLDAIAHDVCKGIFIRPKIHGFCNTPARLFPNRSMPFLINIIRFQANSYIRATFEVVFHVTFSQLGCLSRETEHQMLLGMQDIKNIKGQQAISYLNYLVCLHIIYFSLL